jgi:hypothetical protein
MDPLTLTIIKVVASTCVKLYIGSLTGGGKLVYDEAELGYKVPKWYMNPGKPGKTFYAYGTSVEGDEFESVTDAQEKAVAQMVTHIRISTREAISDSVRYDKESLKQRRLVDLFVRGEGLENFVHTRAKVDRRQLVRVEAQQEMRAFVRIALPSKVYVDYQAETLDALKKRLLQQKAEDILDEMKVELEAWEDEEKPAIPGDPVPDTTPKSVVPAADSAFDELEKAVE